MVEFASGNGFFIDDQEAATVIVNLAKKYCQDDEKVFVGIKGAFKEYLFATNKKIYIYKTGFLVGKTFGFSIFELEYGAISAIQLHKNFGNTGYIEIVGFGILNHNKLSFWGNNSKGPTPQNLDNCLSFGNSVDFYITAVRKLNQLLNDARTPFQGQGDSISKFEEIKQFKELLDLGIISQEEFDEKKEALLKG